MAVDVDAIVLEGEIVLVLDTQEVKVKKGDFVAEMQDTWHYGENKGAVPVKLFVIDEVPHGTASNMVPRK